MYVIRTIRYSMASRVTWSSKGSMTQETKMYYGVVLLGLDIYLLHPAAYDLVGNIYA